jgi:hypothetical protein
MRLLLERLVPTLLLGANAPHGVACNPGTANTLNLILLGDAGNALPQPPLVVRVTFQTPSCLIGN